MGEMRTNKAQAVFMSAPEKETDLKMTVIPWYPLSVVMMIRYLKPLL